MKKNKDTKNILFEMMEKINPDYKKPLILNESEFNIEEKQMIDPNDPEGTNFNPDEEKQQYVNKANKLKNAVDKLLYDEEFDAIDTLTKLLGVPLNEDHSPKYREKIEKIKGKIDFLFDTDHYDIIDKLDTLIDKLYPVNPEMNDTDEIA